MRASLGSFRGRALPPRVLPDLRTRCQWDRREVRLVPETDHPDHVVFSNALMITLDDVGWSLT
jgi:hypothetical protein